MLPLEFPFTHLGDGAGVGALVGLGVGEVLGLRTYSKIEYRDVRTCNGNFIALSAKQHWQTYLGVGEGVGTGEGLYKRIALVRKSHIDCVIAH